MADLIQQLDQIRYQNYLQMATGAALIYSYALNFAREVDLLWTRCWSMTTVLYFLALYSGSFTVYLQICEAVYIKWSKQVMVSVLLLSEWLECAFIISMEAILLLRVFVLCKCSNRALAFLSACFFCQAAAIIVLKALQYNASFMDKYIISTGPPIGSFAQDATSDPAFIPSTPLIYLSVQLAFGALLFAFAIFAFVKHALENKAHQGAWAINPLIKLLITDHTFYFLWFTLLQAVLIAKFTIKAPVTSAWISAIQILLNTLVVIFGPRMVLTLRAKALNTQRSTVEHISMARVDTRNASTSLSRDTKFPWDEIPNEEVGTA
ncbi:hypothetical protein BJ138DRAFT_299725 [Hygrophoropsis aurantiaca]|uniref:Uncharacterized protein n=1 Tax=Hygrophoropsis aurantiaca TaxID=72124 RepID=A0ACB8A788_9AGAM|nr:hypothetical protein BJ138DRAFT_299725 [Hygrophoropsis aurantiaca]